MTKDRVGLLIAFGMILAALFLGPIWLLLLFVVGVTFGGLVYGVWFNMRRSKSDKRKGTAENE